MDVLRDSEKGKRCFMDLISNKMIQDICSIIIAGGFAGLLIGFTIFLILLFIKMR